MCIRRSLLMLALCGPLPSLAVTYYISPNGNDANNGTSPSTPWKTIARLVQSIYSLQAGDQVLFQRGGTYRGEFFIPVSGSSANPIVIGAYGTGADPVISGSDLVTGWVQHSGNIWRAPVAGTVKYLFSNGDLQTLARYPNTGWLRNDQGSGTTLYDAALPQANGYWTGATAVIRSSNWSYDRVTVSGYTNKTLTFPNIYFNLGTQDWGYFLCNKLSELDAPGEWFHDPAAGQLYFWAPGNANPNSLTVEAAKREKGVTVYWQRQHLRLQNLVFEHQTLAGVWVDGASNITVEGCTFRKLYHGLRNVCDNCVYLGNTFSGTYATAASLIDNGSRFENNTLTNIAMVPGLGESNWGYFGVVTNGYNNIVRGNRLETIGYIGIGINRNALVEKNVVVHANALLNDGGGISFDHCDGATIQDNIVFEPLGNLESAATNWVNAHRISHGIYFGNTSIKNTIVQRNTVAHCEGGSGIHVDHTMVSTGNQVKDNVLYDNTVGITLSDYSNYNGPGATPPYYVPNFNGVYSGNIIYAARPGQLCMYQYHVNGTVDVDYGTYTNNRYFAPYDELSIHIHNTFSGVQRSYTLERWQLERGEDAGSTRSPLRSVPYTTATELSSNLVINGTFDVHVNGWTGWPTNAIVTRDLTYLDNGALKANLPNANVYPEFTLRNPDQFAIQNGQWYRMRFSLQSDVHGILRLGVKGVSQFSNPYWVHERKVPFSNERRDMELYFQSNLGDQAVVQFVNHHTEPRYWLDNVQLHRVTVQQVDPLEQSKLFHNETASPANFAVPAGCWNTIAGQPVSGTITVPAYSSVVIYRVPGTGCEQSTAQTLNVRVNLGGALNWSTGVMRTDLRNLGLVPGTEPYTALGWPVANNGATASSAVLQATGAQAVVDWVLLELRGGAPGYALAERRAALLRADGQVVAPDGSVLVGFGTSVAGKHLVVRHRNHLAAMTAQPIAASGATVDLTSASLALYGTDAQQVQGSYRALWPGDVIADGMMRYTGLNNDRDPILIAIGSVTPTNMVSGYLAADVNMDGWVKYSGAGNDRDFILQGIGGSVPTNTRWAQVP